MTTSSFWNTQFQQVRPATRTEVSSEQITRARRSLARMLVTSASKRGLPRRNAASRAPSLMHRPYKSVPRCLEWVETCSRRQPQVELAGQQVDHGLEVSD